MSPSRLTIVIPTISERAAWLAECLDSVLRLADAGTAEIVVSGNGTGASTRKVCAERNVHLVEHPIRMTAAEHGRVILELPAKDWIWILPDDDLVAPDGISRVIHHLDNDSPDVVIGRTRRFVRSDLSDLSVPVPDERPYLVTQSVRAAAEATQMRVDLGAFVFRRGLMTTAMYDRYKGTSHEPFGALWDGIASLVAPRIIVTPDVLIFARQASKAHDENAWRTWLGMLRLADLLPLAVRDVAVSASGDFLSFRPAIRAIAEGEKPTSRDIPNSVWRSAGLTRKSCFRLATHCPPWMARLALSTRTAFPFLSRARGAAVAREHVGAQGINSNDGT